MEAELKAEVLEKPSSRIADTYRSCAACQDQNVENPAEERDALAGAGAQIQDAEEGDRRRRQAAFGSIRTASRAPGEQLYRTSNKRLISLDLAGCAAYGRASGVAREDFSTQLPRIRKLDPKWCCAVSTRWRDWRAVRRRTNKDMIKDLRTESSRSRRKRGWKSRNSRKLVQMVPEGWSARRAGQEGMDWRRTLRLVISTR